MTITEFRKRLKELNKSNKKDCLGNELKYDLIKDILSIKYIKTNVDKAFLKIFVIDYFNFNNLWSPADLTKTKTKTKYKKMLKFIAYEDDKFMFRYTYHKSIKEISNLVDSLTLYYIIYKNT